ncbi:hypothetical protein MWU65_01530 [Cellulophaga sp. F20128]|uniref:hypothetical protein n=1 Tax=Cellulophaga sp. F20128 TaxID=2926413 RepID=UPI001FF6C705|nr:hypothetical protein [Cellulophaga sp. F20128]MCK0155840.1 hypothetical protein [Cellulophaga sp. F20128]
MARKNKTLKLIALAVSVFFILFITLQWVVKKRIENFIDKKTPSHLQISYTNLRLNLASGNLVVDSIKVAFFNRDSLAKQAELKLDQLTVKDIGYFNLLLDNTISLQQLIVNKPRLKFEVSKETSRSNSEEQQTKPFPKNINISELKIVDGTIEIKNSTTQNLASVKKLNLSLKKIVITTETIKNKIPFTYANYELSTKNLLLDLGRFEQLKIGSITATKEELAIYDFNLKSKYTREELTKNLFTERDQVNLTIPKTTVKKLRIGFVEDQLFIKSPKIKINTPRIEIYRDKRVKDDLSYKPLYSQLLRTATANINITEVKLTDGYVSYEERLETNIDPEKLFFSKLNATIDQINNTPLAKEKTSIKAETMVMNKTPLHLNWSFYASDVSDSFTASGNFKNLNIVSLNPFLKSNLRAQAEGDMHTMYFTISGNRIKSTGNMKMKYDNFKFRILKKDRLGVNKLLTKIGNIFINDGSATDDEGYRHGAIEVDRDPTKSFFNYLWLNVKEGMLNTLTGKGVKKKDE